MMSTFRYSLFQNKSVAKTPIKFFNRTLLHGGGG